jgi:hypothetical protein
MSPANEFAIRINAHVRLCDYVASLRGDHNSVRELAIVGILDRL